MITWTISAAHAGQRLNKYLMRKLPDAQSSFLYRMLRKKNITLNHKKASGSELLQEGDLVTLFLSDETILKFGGISDTEPYRRAYDRIDAKIGANGILYEDEHVLFVRKPVGILSQKASAQDISMNDWLLGYLLKKKQCTAESIREFKPSAVNRLDRNTGGILLCAKSLQGARVLTQLIRDRSVRKYYRAVVIGRPPARGEISGAISKDHVSNKVSFDSSDAAQTNSITKYHRLRTGERFSLLEMELITGKTHQLRSHLASIGHPIGGDHKYGDAKANKQLENQYGVRGQLLWCCRVEFPKDTGKLKNLSGRIVRCDPPTLYENIVSSGSEDRFLHERSSL